jgi:hypothetical protein
MAIAGNHRPALQRQRRVLDGVTHAGPRQQRCRRRESTLAHGLLRIGHTAPHRDAALDGAAKCADRRVRKRRNFSNRRHA